MDNKNTARFTRKNLIIAAAVAASVLTVLLIIVLLVLAARPANNPAPQSEKPIASSPVVNTPTVSFPNSGGSAQQPGASNVLKQLSEKLGEVKIEMQVPLSYQVKKLTQVLDPQFGLETTLNIESSDLKLIFRKALGGMGGATSLSKRSDFPDIELLKDAAGNNLQRSYDRIGNYGKDPVFTFHALYSSDGVQDKCGELGIELDQYEQEMCASGGKLFFPASNPGIQVYSEDSGIDDGSEVTMFVDCYAKSKAGFESCDQMVKTMRMRL